MAKKYSLILAPAAKRDLKKLPPNVQNQIVFEHLPEIERDPLGVGSRENLYKRAKRRATGNRKQDRQ
jgi:mRNA-degrading endonuclease RelE of RelBE toxin-antitoxin system